ncbi:MAG: ABC transporter substrate-binding protein [Lachnospiraceae bacterium]|nr:ABC transporter substrate-binding protein [Lachnospiraceae bacterium]
MKRTKLLATVLAAVMALSLLALTACGGSEPEPTPVGSGSGSDAPAGGTIVIGASGPLTGDASSYGISVQKGAQLAVDEINANGGNCFGMKFAFNMKDDKATAADASTAFGQLMDEGMQVSLGAVTSGSCEAFGAQAAEAKVFFITPSASAASVIETSNYAFRVCFGDPDQGILAAEELTSKYTKIGCIYDTSDTYSSGIYDAFDAKMKELGVEYTTRTFDADNKKDFSAQVEALKDCEVIFCPFYYTEASLVARACAAKEFDNIELFGCDGFDGLAPILEENVKNPIRYITPFDVDSTDEFTAKFVKNYTDKYGVAPDQFAADGYDAVYILKNALERAGVQDDSVKASDIADDLVAVLTDPSFGYTGVTGMMTWDASGACTKVPVIVVLN